MNEATATAVDKSVIAIPGENPYDNDKSIVVKIKARKDKGLQTYEVYWLIPETDEECQEHYNCALKDLIAQGVRNLSTRPPYQLEFEKGADTLTEEGHIRCQALADAYKCGATRSTATKAMTAIKAKAAKCGLSMDEVLAMLEQYENNQTDEA